MSAGIHADYLVGCGVGHAKCCATCDHTIKDIECRDCFCNLHKAWVKGFYTCSSHDMTFMEFGNEVCE